jgi:hypothetical protein
MVRTYWAVIIACLSLGWSAAQTRELVLFPFCAGRGSATDRRV